MVRRCRRPLLKRFSQVRLLPRQQRDRLVSAASAPAAGEPSQETPALNVGLVGVGCWGSNLARNFHKLGALAALCDRSEEVRQRLAADYPGVPVHASLDSLLDTEGIEAVAVATRASQHAAAASMALQRGLHVYVEKPLATTMAEARDLVSQAKSAGVTIFVGHLLRYHPGFCRLLELACAGALGTLESASATRLGIGPARAGEDVLWEYAPHDVSMLLALADSPLRGVRCHAMRETGGRMRQVCALLEFESGFQAHVVAGDRSSIKEQRLAVHGTNAVAVFDDTLGWENKLALYGADGEGPGRPVPLQAAEPLALECGAFLRSAALGEDCPTDGPEALRVMEALDACLKSTAAF